MVTVTLIAYKLCKSSPLLVMSITEVEEGRPTSQTVKPSSSPKKEATGFKLLTTSTTGARAIDGNGKTMTSTLKLSTV